MTPKATRTLNIGVLLYPGAMRSAVYGLQELMAVANGKKATLAMQNWPQFEVSLWSDDGASQRASL